MRVYSPSPAFAALADLTTYKRVQIIRRYVGRSVMQIELPAESDIISYMQKNCWIVADDGEPFIIRNVTQTEQAVTIYAYGGHFGFEGRITTPPAGMYAIEKTGSADVVVKEFIKNTLTVGNRALNITCAANQGGASISDQSRLKNLGDEVLRVLTSAGLGERFRLVGGAIAFDTYAGADRSASCVFDLKYKNVQDFTYTLDATKTQSTAIVGGAGEGVDREMYIVGDEAAGWDRREVFIDARDVEAGDTAKLTERAAQAIIGNDQQVKADVAASANLVFGVDYFLGDIVTVNVPVKSYQANGAYFNPVVTTIPIDVRITEATETIDNGVHTIDLTFGDNIPKSEIAQIRSELAQLKSTEPDTAIAAVDILTALKTVDGSGSGLDADLLDGKEATAFLLAALYTAADVLAKLKTVDGAGTGLDADLLDGLQAVAFATSAQGVKADNAVPKTSAGRPGVYRLYRNDADDAYNVQITWDSVRWLLRGYINDTYHAPCRVDYADNAGNSGNSATLDGIDSSGFVQMLGASSYKILRGTCSIGSADWTTVSFGVTFSGMPQVYLTPWTSTTGVIAPKAASVTTSGFNAIIGGTGFSSIGCRWLAVGF